MSDFMIPSKLHINTARCLHAVKDCDCCDIIRLDERQKVIDEILHDLRQHKATLIASDATDYGYRLAIDGELGGIQYCISLIDKFKQKEVMQP